MCVSGFRPESGTLHRDPNDRNPVPQSRINCVPSGATNSRHGVFPPYRHVAGSTVGVEPRTPQKLNLLTGTDIFLSYAPGKSPYITLIACAGKLFRYSQCFWDASIASLGLSVKVPNNRAKDWSSSARGFARVTLSRHN